MTIILHAQPYDIAAQGFYFDTLEEYQAKAAKAVNDYGDPVEEFEIQFIDGDQIDCALAQAIGLCQSNIGQYFDAVEAWDDPQKRVVILAAGDCGYDFTDQTQPDDFDIEIYHIDSLRALAEQFVDEGLFGEIPGQLQHYIDYDAIARDLAADYSETEIAGIPLVYRCG
ncbi:hypothetical protein MACH17_28560 [Phaeobacter inhibens]|uniref:antirestriction protein ArdA n=1 Tax=Phaeobacter inhibens TaxID=221822 RepID=UPI00276AE80C|nr:antirestriction protein ArdA [Phaeobacter inhibens]GLO71339.1 hypothetical protein MACH17_28560 [Phaeobacter inhibens]